VLFRSGGALLHAIAGNAARSRTTEPRCGEDCDRFGALARIPAAYMLSGLDVAPALMVHTPHRFPASGYHRNAGPLRRTIDVFTGDAARAHRTMIATGMAYVIVDPGSDETGLYVAAAPRGFMADLVQGRVPPWLRPVPLPGSPYRLRKRIG
jgi:hypothetical protein